MASEQMASYGYQILSGILALSKGAALAVELGLALKSRECAAFRTAKLKIGISWYLVPDLDIATLILVVC